MKILITRTKKGKTIQKVLDVVLHDHELLIKDGKKVDFYRVEEQVVNHPEVKREFTLTKTDGDVYCVRFKNRHTTCSCKGFAAENHCKHQDTMDQLCTTGNVEGIRLFSLVG